MIQYIDTKSKATVNLVGIEVLIDGLTITAKAGKFVIASTEYELTEDFEYTVSPLPSDDLWICGDLVKEIATGNIEVLIDAINPGEPNYDWSGSPYKKLHSLYWFKVPGGATSLEGLDIRVSRIIEDLSPGL